MDFELMPVRLDKTLPPDAEQQLDAAFDTILALLGPPTAISQEEFDKLYQMSDKRKTNADEHYKVMAANPQYMENPPLDKVAMSRRYYEFCELVWARVEGCKTRLQHEQDIAGAQYANWCKSYQVTAKYLSESRKDAQATLVLKQFADIDKRPHKRAKEGGGESPTPTPQHAA